MGPRPPRKSIWPRWKNPIRWAALSAAAPSGGASLEDLNVGGLGAEELRGGGLDEEELGDATLAETLLHIPCPNGHELDVPLDMLGAWVMCPHCQAEFRPRREKSVEYQREQEIIEAKRRSSGSNWPSSRPVSSGSCSW